MNIISNHFFKRIWSFDRLKSTLWIRGMLIGALVLVLVQVSLFGLYRVPSHSMEPVLSVGNVIGLNKCAFGLQLPFFHGSLIHWKLPKVGDIIAIETKDRHRLLKSVMGLPRDVLTVKKRRFVVPDGYVLVGDTSPLTQNKRNCILIPAKKILGRLAFVVR